MPITSTVKKNPDKTISKGEVTIPEEYNQDNIILEVDISAAITYTKHIFVEDVIPDGNPDHRRTVPPIVPDGNKFKLGKAKDIRGHVIYVAVSIVKVPAHPVPTNADGTYEEDQPFTVKYTMTAEIDTYKVENSHVTGLHPKSVTEKLVTEFNMQ